MAVVSAFTAGIIASRSRRGCQDKAARAGYTYLHSAIDGFTRLVYTEPHDDETAATGAKTLLFRRSMSDMTKVITTYTRHTRPFKYKIFFT